MNRSSTESTLQLHNILNELQKYKTETKQLKEELNRLKTENELKNELLEEQSKHIISYLSETIALRKEIKCLQTTLQKQKQKHISLYNSSANEQEHKQMPYLLISEETLPSNLSAQACKLSLPCVAKNNIQLKIIAESDPRAPWIDKTTLSPITPITPITLNLNESTNNSNIHHEFAQSVATISDDGSNRDYKVEEMDHLTLTTFASNRSNASNVSNASDDMNFVYVDYDEEGDDDENINDNGFIYDDEMMSVQFKAISVLTDLTDVENEQM